MSILKKCPVEKLVALFSTYGDVVEVSMPTESSPGFGVEFLDVDAAKKAIVAGKASSGAFQAVFDADANPDADAVWIGGLEMPPPSSGIPGSSLRRQLTAKFADFERSPASIWLARSKSQAVVEFSTPVVAARVLAALKAERREGAAAKLEFDLISTKGTKAFVEKLSEDDRVDNKKLQDRKADGFRGGDGQ